MPNRFFVVAQPLQRTQSQCHRQQRDSPQPTEVKAQGKGVSQMPLFPDIFIFKNIREGVCLSYIVPCGSSGDAERREMLGGGNEEISIWQNYDFVSVVI